MSGRSTKYLLSSNFSLSVLRVENQSNQVHIASRKTRSLILLVLRQSLKIARNKKKVLFQECRSLFFMALQQQGIGIRARLH